MLNQALTTVRFSGRLVRLGVHLLMGTVVCALLFPWLPHIAKEWFIRQWSARLLSIFGVQVNYMLSEEPARDIATNKLPVLQYGLVVANHLSWLDVFVINTLQPCRFVAKSEIRTWPLLGFLCSKTRTIFISRSSARDVRNIFRQLAQSIQDGDYVAFFPEGTTAMQGQLLPFHANLFESAITSGVPIQPVALRYLNQQGNLHTEIDYTGTVTFGQSMMRILRSGAINAQIIVLPTIADNGGGRRELAQTVQQKIAAALGH